MICILLLITGFISAARCAVLHGASNSPPTTPEIVLLPAPPIDDDNLQCKIVSDSLDPDDDEVTYSYWWFKNGVIQRDLTDSTVPSPYTTPGDVWTCRVTPTDGFDEGPWVTGDVTILDNLSIVTTSLPNGALQSSYSRVIRAQGGISPYVWSVVSGSLPQALSLNSTTGEISGTVVGTPAKSEFSIMVTDSVSHATTSLMSITTEASSQPTSSTPGSGGETTNQPPAFSQIGNQTATEGLLLTFTLSASDPDSDPLTYSANALPGGATFDSSSHIFSWTPGVGWAGAYSVTFQVSDGRGGVASLDITITVNAPTPGNQPPVAVGDTTSTNEDTAVTIYVLANDTDPEADALSVASITPASHGSATSNGANVTYTPAANYYGTDSFTYKANDGAVDSNVATVTISVNPVNDAPVANDDSAITDEDVPVTVNVLSNDSDPDLDPLQVSSMSDPPHGTAVVNGDNTITYTPDANYNVSDSFTYTVSDGKGGTATATVSVTINAVNDAPVAVGDSYSVDVGSPLTVTAPGVLGNDSDVEGDTLTAVVAIEPLYGTLTLNSDGSFIYQPTGSDSDSFTYTVSDGNGGTATATVSITVNA